MESRRTQTVARQQNISDSFYDAAFNNADSSSSSDGEDETRERLTALLAANAEISLENSLYRDLCEKTEAELMRHPLSVKKAFAYLGLLLGIFPPAAIFYRMFSDFNGDVAGIIVLFFFVNLICAAVGYFSGKLIGRMVGEMEKHSWHLMLLTLPFIGVFWGMMTGGAGGILIFVIGAFFGAILAAMVGSVAVTAFTIFHRLLKKGEMIERKHFLPLAFGITFTISAFILGL